MDEQPPPSSPDPGAGAGFAGDAGQLRRPRTRRFVERYEQRKALRERGETRFYVRPLRIVAGVLLIVIAPVVGAIPGPGGLLVLLPGAFLLASEVRRAALVMDRVENETIPRLQRLRARLRGGPKQRWVDDDPEQWANWCERRNMNLPDTGSRRRSTDDRGGEGDREHRPRT